MILIFIIRPNQPDATEDKVDDDNAVPDEPQYLIRPQVSGIRQVQRNKDRQDAIKKPGDKTKDNKAEEVEDDRDEAGFIVLQEASHSLLRFGIWTKTG